MDDVAHVHGAVIEGVRGRLGQEVQCARHLLYQHKAGQRAAAGLGHTCDAPAALDDQSFEGLASTVIFYLLKPDSAQPLVLAMRVTPLPHWMISPLRV